jgi:hypothetical protein
MKVNVFYPTANRNFEMDVESSTTLTSLVNELIEEGHLPRLPESYELHRKGAAEGSDLLNMDGSLESNKIAENAQLVVTQKVKGGAVLR